MDVLGVEVRENRREAQVFGRSWKLVFSGNSGRLRSGWKERCPRLSGVGAVPISGEKIKPFSRQRSWLGPRALP